MDLSKSYVAATRESIERENEKEQALARAREESKTKRKSKKKANTTEQPVASGVVTAEQEISAVVQEALSNVKKNVQAETNKAGWGSYFGSFLWRQQTNPLVASTPAIEKVEEHVSVVDNVPTEQSPTSDNKPESPVEIKITSLGSPYKIGASPSKLGSFAFTRAVQTDDAQAKTEELENNKTCRIM